ncbi:hypothetical protein [Streptosporangium nondiastaticum]|uniref:hypothetical protein n=1 Tax=Streptosporangium nondiastaticum TaxID=35764 RepID=UPI0011B1EFCE|nr:hypothetical protein [Streptosporangium nondiastaticum]
MENPNYGPPKDDVAKLTDSKSWLDSLGEQPAVAVRDSIAGILHEQVPGAVLEWIKILDVPRYLTGGRPQYEDASHMIVTRAGITLSFALSVTSPGRKRSPLPRRHHLRLAPSESRVGTTCLTETVVTLNRPGGTGPAVPSSRRFPADA